MTIADRGDAVRLSAVLAQCEMSLVRRDPVAAVLLAQAARHAAGLGPGALVAAAARLARAVDTTGRAPDQRAARKVVQALVRAAVIQVDAALLESAGP
ncbi:MAG: hypothetical protein AB7V42_16410 [Thermoleophilia bacterium]